MFTDEGEGTDQVRSCLACSVEGSTLCSRCPDYDILYCHKYDHFIVVLFSQIFLHLILNQRTPQKPCIWLGFPRGKCRQRSWAECSTTSCSRRQDPGDELDWFRELRLPYICFVFPLKLYYYLAQFFTVKPYKGEVLQGGNLLGFFNILVINLQRFHEILRNSCSAQCTPQAPCRSPRTWASSWWTPRSASSPARRSESQTCQGCPACGCNEVHHCFGDQYASVGKKEKQTTFALIENKQANMPRMTKKATKYVSNGKKMLGMSTHLAVGLWFLEPILDGHLN